MTSNTPENKYHHSNTCMVHAFICMHAGFDCNCDRFVCLAAAEEDCVCIRRSCCLAPGRVPSRGVGCVTDNREGSEEICKLGLFCCDYGFIVPSCSDDRPLCSRTVKSCCFYEVCAFPFHRDIVPEPVCAYYGIQCAPRCVCCAPPPRSFALDRLIGLRSIPVSSIPIVEAMDRGDAGEPLLKEYPEHPVDGVEMAHAEYVV
mmetsp:Transcript_23796/g.39341  ORF Transcript_23796/g.39341 Transcript_23796/m.39341 type:complete len:202 (-) Transcript_23796:124-729(-)